MERVVEQSIEPAGAGRGSQCRDVSAFSGPGHDWSRGMVRCDAREVLQRESLLLRGVRPEGVVLEGISVNNGYPGSPDQSADGGVFKVDSYKRRS